jgi:hypothetical protein
MNRMMSIVGINYSAISMALFVTIMSKENRSNILRRLPETLLDPLEARLLSLRPRSPTY